MGHTGTSTGPHLHYEVWKNGKIQNPIRYVNIEEFFKS
jgi:murein DD-endopeptidase MepM/ murein hydrolase activator NlpD